MSTLVGIELLVLAAVLFLLGITNRGHRVREALRFAMGVVIAGFGTLSFWRDKTHEGTGRIASCNECSIQIVSPAVGDRVGRSFPVIGTYKSLPITGAM